MLKFRDYVTEQSRGTLFVFDIDDTKSKKILEDSISFLNSKRSIPII